MNCMFAADNITGNICSLEKASVHKQLCQSENSVYYAHTTLASFLLRAFRTFEVSISNFPFLTSGIQGDSLVLFFQVLFRSTDSRVFNVYSVF